MTQNKQCGFGSTPTRFCTNRTCELLEKQPVCCMSFMEYSFSSFISHETRLIFKYSPFECVMRMNVVICDSSLEMTPKNVSRRRIVFVPLKELKWNFRCVRNIQEPFTKCRHNALLSRQTCTRQLVPNILCAFLFRT